MSINLSVPNNCDIPDLRPRITVFGVGGAGCNAVNNMIHAQLEGVNFVVANTDAQALAQARTDSRIQLGVNSTRGLGAGNRPDVGQAAAEETLDEILGHLNGSNMTFITAGMGGGTGTGAAPVIARVAKEQGILTVGVVTKPFHFEGVHRMRIAEAGIEELEQFVDTLIIIPNQNLFRVANERTTFADAFKMADDVLYSGVRGVTDLMVMPGLINLDFADIKTVMSEMGKAMMGTGEGEGERRALDAAEAAIANPLLDDISMKGAKGVLINITGGSDMTLFEVDEAANRIRAEVDQEAYIIFGSTFDDQLEGKMRISVVATGMSIEAQTQPAPVAIEVPSRLKTVRTPTLAELNAKEGPVRTPDQQPRLSEIAAGMEQKAAKDGVDTTHKDVEPAEIVTVSREPAEVRHPAAAGEASPPAENLGGAFIPPAPIEKSTQPIAKNPDPFAGAAVLNSGTAMQGAESQGKSRGPSLFEKVTGTGRAAKIKTLQTETKEAKAEAGAQPKVGSVDPSERFSGSQTGDDLLDIPAFLRRQAN